MRCGTCTRHRWITFTRRSCQIQPHSSACARCFCQKRTRGRATAAWGSLGARFCPATTLGRVMSWWSGSSSTPARCPCQILAHGPRCVQFAPHWLPRSHRAHCGWHLLQAGFVVVTAAREPLLHHVLCLLRSVRSHHPHAATHPIVVWDLGLTASSRATVQQEVAGVEFR